MSDRHLEDLRVPELKKELEDRNLDSRGQKQILRHRLQAAMEEEGIDVNTYVFAIGPDCPDGEETASQDGANVTEKSSPQLDISEMLRKMMIKLYARAANLDAWAADVNAKLDAGAAKLDARATDVNAKLNARAAEFKAKLDAQRQCMKEFWDSEAEESEDEEKLEPHERKKLRKSKAMPDSSEEEEEDDDDVLCEELKDLIDDNPIEEDGSGGEDTDASGRSPKRIYNDDDDLDCYGPTLSPGPPKIH